MSKYVAYVGSYTYVGHSRGITILDVDTESASMKKRCEVEVNNAPYLVSSPDNTLLYCIVNEGVITFRILPDGNLEKLATAQIHGMRGRFLDLDPQGEFLAEAGDHDGKTSIMRINPDGTAGERCDGIYDAGMGSIAERDSQPHVSCVRFTRDGKYLLSADTGLDNIKVFRVHRPSGKLTQVSTLHCDMKSAPNRMVFSKDGRFLYVTCQIANTIVVFSYEEQNGRPVFRRIQTVPTVGERSANSSVTAAMHVDLTSDDAHLLYTSVGDNNLGMFDRDAQTGLLTHRFSLPVSGRYPKDFILFPDEKHICLVNYEEGSLTFFSLNCERGLIIMNTAPIPIDQPCCGILVPLKEE